MNSLYFANADRWLLLYLNSKFFKDMQDMLEGFEDRPRLFSKRNNIIYGSILLALIALCVFIIIYTVPKESVLKILKSSRTQYLRNLLMGLSILQLIPVMLTFVIGLIPIKKMYYKDKLFRMFLLIAIILNLVLSVLFLV